MLDVAMDAVGEVTAFYERLLGWRVATSHPGWALLESPDGRLKVEVQGSAGYAPPVWPGVDGEQQMMVHVDFATDDLEAAVALALEAGATLAAHQPDPDVRVLLDPAGHPFCLFEAPSGR